MKANKTSRSLMSLTISIVCLGALIYAGYQLFRIESNYRAIDQANRALREAYQVTPEPRTADDSSDTDGYFIIDWDALLERNEHVVGWIYVPGTAINYPILKGENNDTYLHHDIDGNESIAGSIFMEAMNSPDFLDLNTIIYGHNMLNGAKFSAIDDMARGRLAEMPAYVYLYLPNQSVKVYRIISAHVVDAFSDIYALPVKDLEAYYELILETSLIDVEFNRLELPRVLTLSTCAEADQTNTSRSVIHGVLIREVDLIRTSP